MKRKEEDSRFTVKEATVDALTEQHVIEALFARHDWETVKAGEVEPLFHVQISGDFSVQIVCARFAWKQDDKEFVIPTLAHQIM